MRASVQFPREKFGLAANSNAASETAKAKMISSSVWSSGFIVSGTFGADERDESPSRENIRTATRTTGDQWISGTPIDRHAHRGTRCEATL